MTSLLGIEIGGSKLQLVLGDADGRVYARRRFVVSRAQGAEGIRRQIERAIPELLEEGRIDAVGVGFGGPVDWRTGTTNRSHHLEGWMGFALADWLRTQTGTAVRVDNDANVAALGEAQCGSGMGLNPVCYVTLGSGVGGGLVTKGRIYHGASPGEVEIGHLRLDRDGTTIESRCAGWAVDARIRDLAISQPAGVLARLVGGESGGEARHLAAALAMGDAAAEGVLRDVAENLSFGLSHVVHLLHPQVIILGGGLSGVGEPLRVAVEAALSGFTMPAFQPVPEIRLTALGEDAVPVGALLLAGSHD